MSRAAAALALLALAGCFPKVPFVPTPDAGRYEGMDGDYAVELPKGWMRVNDDDALRITRDGPSLQRIVIQRGDAKKPLRGSKRVLSPAMEPFEIAELVAGEMSSAEGVTGLKILENAPASVGRRPGFRLIISYKDADGLRMKSVHYGVVTEGWFWELAYAAPARVYFDRDLRTFEAMVRSFDLARTR
jgi:hypothetical protein